MFDQILIILQRRLPPPQASTRCLPRFLSMLLSLMRPFRRAFSFIHLLGVVSASAFDFSVSPEHFLSYAASGDCTLFDRETSLYLGAAPVATSNSPLASK